MCDIVNVLRMKNKIIIRWKSNPQNKQLEEQKLGTLAVVETRVSLVCTELRSKLQKLEEEFTVKNKKPPTTEVIEQGKEMREEYERYKLSKQLLHHWRMKSTSLHNHHNTL